MKKFLGSFVPFGAVAAVLAPLSVFAQSVGADCANLNGGNVGGIEYALCRVAYIINAIIPVLITLGVVYFIYGVITYVISKDEEAKKRGTTVMIYGIIGLVVIVSVWGLVTIVKSTFGIGDQNTISVPCIESPGITCPQTSTT